MTKEKPEVRAKNIGLSRLCLELCLGKTRLGHYPEAVYHPFAFKISISPSTIPVAKTTKYYYPRG
ncbi:hypothetical protein MASR1M36_10850 [Candidatus Cloacimonadaceae bacterium]